MLELNGDSLRRFMDMLRGVSGVEDEGYEPLATLSPEQRTEWVEIERLRDESQFMASEAQARSQLFWLRLERLLKSSGIDSESLKVDDGIVYGRTPKVPDVPDGLPQLGDD